MIKKYNRSPVNNETKEANYFLIDKITHDTEVEHEKDNGKNS